MPSKAPHVSSPLVARLRALGEQIRAQRKDLQVSATSAAESAGMSRVTWHRIENGETSVTMGAYAMAMSVLGLTWGLLPQKAVPPEPALDTREWIPVRVSLSDYPELKKLAWQVHGTDELTPLEALGIYERNVRHLDEDAMLPHERNLVDALRKALGEGRRHV